MDARAKTVRDILHSGDQYLVPFFQRFYSWSHKHWDRLWSDLTALVDDGDNNQHFLGPLVCTPMKHVATEVPAYQLIDGQQRLTTLTILLAALRDVCRMNGQTDVADEVMEDYLVHKRKKDLQRYKVVPRTGDRELLIGLIEGRIPEGHKRDRVIRASQYFRRRVEKLAAERTPQALQKLFAAVTARLSLVVITIDGENPYEIFESLNSTGLPLEQSDLVRNYVFMEVPLAEQERFQQEHWEPFESLFEESNSDPAIPATAFYRSYLMRSGVYLKSKTTFEDFRAENRRRGLSPADQVADLKRFAGFALCLYRPHTCKQPAVRRALSQIAMLDITTAHPLLLNLLDRHERGDLDEAGLLGCLDDLASFVMRRSICGESTRQYGRWFAEAAKAIDSNPRADLQQYWIKRGWPDDKAFLARLLDFSLYRREPKKCRLVLETLERSYGHKETVDLGTLTIEHVMPQTIGQGKYGQAWKQALGEEDWRTVHSQWLHTLGNLTLSGYNEDMSNRPFADKRQELANSNVVLNRYFADLRTWDGPAIEKRGKALAKQVAELWPRPAAGAYVAPQPAERRRLDPEQRRQLRKEFWTGFADLLKANAAAVKIPKPTRRGWIGFPIGRSSIYLWTYINTTRNRIGVGLTCGGSKGEQHFLALSQQKAAIEAELGFPLNWEELPQQKARYLSVYRNADLQDQQSWAELQEWLLNTLVRMHQVLVPRVKEVRPQREAAPGPEA